MYVYTCMYVCVCMYNHMYVYVLVMFVSTFAVVSHHLTHNVSAALLGLALAYAIPITGTGSSINLLTHLLTYSLTHLLTYSLTHLPT